MKTRVITLRYSEGLQGFPEDDLAKVVSGCDVLEVRDHFFMHGNVPHLALVLLLNGDNTKPETKFRPENDPGTALSEHLQKLYRDLRQWRNERAKQDGVPSYVIMRNVQIAEICRRLPHSLAALKEIEGIGEGTCQKYGQDILKLIPDDLQPEPSAAAGKTPEEGDEGR
ncbi:HRDC domain-containing protein [Oligosphaera ethanolica]|uniref:Superfamily II DNA helicase RecQ n=1 Tax=Oligosphaera ethanolica TaxID=760260 RepID=A0AAE4ANJ1_9BACT|nr:HRDC domain-containing protein [Oligosphaera ethanolica]MDQ0288417.1 superfamily II DNA helicase RecQ [Oligosphaera ethanolica]